MGLCPGAWSSGPLKPTGEGVWGLGHWDHMVALGHIVVDVDVSTQNVFWVTHGVRFKRVTHRVR